MPCSGCGGRRSQATASPVEASRTLQYQLRKVDGTVVVYDDFVEARSAKSDPGDKVFAVRIATNTP
jgi:hypothetical protein